MKLNEFIELYCKDIIINKKKQADLLDDDDFPYDDIIYDEDENPVKVVYSPAGDIPINDILGLDRSEFAKAYPSHGYLFAYDRYVDSIIILEGEEALLRIRNMMTEQQREIELYAQLPEEL